MKKKRKIESDNRKACLPDEMMVDVLSRIPIKSFIRFRCVSKEWLRLMHSSPSLKLILLMLNILPWLPVKSLLRFRCVSKTWLHFIPDPSFKKVRDVLRTPNQFVLLTELNRSDLKRSISLQTIDLLDGKLQCEFRLTSCSSSYWLSNSCYGLVYFSDLIAKNIYVCNPSTHERVKLPVSPLASLRNLRVGIGMGYLPESNTYKIVVWFAHNITTSDDGDSHQVSGFEIFALTDGGKPRSSQWRLVKNHPHLIPKPSQYYRGNGFSARGEIYWMLTGNWGCTKNGWKILAFDLTTEEERIIQPPATWVHRQGWSTDLVELRGSLCVVGTCQIGLSLTMGETVIWMLEDRDVWAKPYIICKYLTPLLTYVGQQVEDSNLVFIPESGSYIHIHYYHMKNQSITMSSEHSRVVRNRQRAFVFCDTLFSLKPQASSRRAKKKQG